MQTVGNASDQGKRGNVKACSCAHAGVFVCACSLSSYFGAPVFVHSHVCCLMFCVQCAVCSARCSAYVCLCVFTRRVLSG